MNKLGYAQSRVFTDPSPQTKQPHEVCTWDKQAAKHRAPVHKFRVPTRGFFTSLKESV